MSAHVRGEVIIFLVSILVHDKLAKRPNLRKMRAVFCKQYCQQNPIGRDALDELSPRGSRVGGISFQEVQVVSKRELTSCGRRVCRSLLLVAIAYFSRCELATFDDRHPLPELAERK